QEYDGFFNMLPNLPPLISQPISQPNWKLYRVSSIDHERLVCMKMPSSVLEMSWSKVSGFSPGRMEMFVMRMMGMRFQPSARMVPLERCSPISPAVSRDERYPVNRPLLMMGVHCAGTPSSSYANVPSPGPCCSVASATTV